MYFRWDNASHSLQRSLRKAFLAFINCFALITVICRTMTPNTPLDWSGLSNGINWRTPSELPDTNPIGNLWHKLKEFIRREVMPKKNKSVLVEGIKRFWLTVDATKCHIYIRRLRNVIPRIIELNGDATGY